MDESGGSKGFGFVHFESSEAADSAITTVNEKMLGAKKVYVGKFQPKRERMRQKESSWTNVYVKDLDPSVTDAELRQKFTEFGPITSCVIMRREDATSKGFGFVNFENHEDARNAVDHCQSYVIHSKPIWCGRAQKKAERQAELQKKFKQLKMEQFTRFQGINLYIKNLEDDIDEERLKKEFSAFGQIRSAKIMDDKGVSKGFGFICFTTAEEAQHAINEMNSRILQGCTKPLYVALHEPKDIRRQKLAQRHAHRTKHLRPPNVPNVPGPASFVSAPPPVYYQSPPAGSAPFPVYQQTPQPPLPRQPARAWPGGAPQHQAQQYPVQQPASYVQARTARGGRSGQMGGGRGGGGRGTSNRRNNQQGGPPQELGMIPHEISMQQLDQYPPDQQKLLLGERLYPMIQKTQPQLSGKITGMLLDSGWSIEVLFSLLGDEEKLNQKIDEAVGVLKRAQQQQEVDGTDEYQDQPGDDGENH